VDTWNGMPVIDETTKIEDFFLPSETRGGEPRDYGIQPKEVFASADAIQPMTIPELIGRIEELDREEATLDHVLLRARAKKRFTDLYQDGYNFCWAHSTAHAVMLAREVANQPHVPLSAFGLAHLAEAARALNNRGGWCGLSAQAAREKGVPSQAKYPQLKVLRSVSQDILDDAALYRVSEDFVDLQQPVWYQNLPFETVGTCLQSGRPCALDYNFMSHSVCGIKLVQIEKGSTIDSLGIMVLDSHGLQKGDQGRWIIRGRRAIPDGAIAVNTVRK
jgi:hypothetical protein